MASQKSNEKSYSHKIKGGFKIGVNKSAESMLRQSFQPKFSPVDNKARLTFCGLEHSYNNEKRKVDGETQTVQIPKIVIVFSCMDETLQNPQNIGIRVNYNVSRTNFLGKFLTLLGYELKEITTIVNKDDDEYGTSSGIEFNPGEIFDFLRSKCGLVFKAEMEKAIGTNRQGEKYQKGLWNILSNTLEPFVKNGTHIRDMAETDITDEDFENPHISMLSTEEN